MIVRRGLARVMDAASSGVGRLAAGLAPADGALMERWGRLPPNLRGILWIMAAGVALTIMTAMIKVLGTRIPVVQILFLRQLVLTVMLAPRMIRDPKAAFATEYLPLHGLRALFALIAMMTGFTAIVHLPLADAVAISFSKSFFVTIFAILILREVVGRHRWAAVLLGFVGVLIMVRPSPEGFDPYALLGLISAASVGLVMVIIRKLAQREPLGTVMSYQAVLVGGALIVPAWLYWVPPTAGEWGMLLMIGFLSAVGQSLNFNGFRVGEATAVASADYLRLVYATALGVLVFNEWPTLPALAGAALIIGTTLYAMWAERRPPRPSKPRRPAAPVATPAE